MRLLSRYLLLIFYSAPAWSAFNRTRREAILTDINHLHQRYPDIDKYLPILCKHHNRMPWFRRHQEQVFAVNEQLIPQPFPYSFDNQHHSGHHHDIFPDNDLHIHSQFPSRDFDSPVRSNTNDIFSVNQQYANNFPNEYGNQIQRPPTGYDGQHHHSHSYKYNPRTHNYQRVNQPNNNVAKTINIDINAESQDNIPINNIDGQRSRQALRPPYNQNNYNTLPVNPNSYGPTSYQDGYDGSTLYPRSTAYLDKSNAPVDLLFASSENDPISVGSHLSTNDYRPPYIIDPRLLSIFDDYIQSKIDESKKKESQDKKQNSDKSSKSSNNQTITS